MADLPGDRLRIDPASVSVEVRDGEGVEPVTGTDPKAWRKVTPSTMAKAMRTIRDGSPEALGIHASYIGNVAAYLSDPENGDHDATDADIVLQVACFGRVIFG